MITVRTKPATRFKAFTADASTAFAAYIRRRVIPTDLAELSHKSPFLSLYKVRKQHKDHGKDHKRKSKYN